MNPSEEKTELRTVDDFIAFFSAIPEDQWCIGTYDNCEGARCARGHLGEVWNNRPANSARFMNLLEKHLGRDRWTNAAVSINDGLDNRFKQPTPRARILAALNAIKANKHD